MDKKSWKNVQGNLANPTSSWESSVYSSTMCVFTKKGSLDKPFFEVGELSLWILTTPSEDDRICSKYSNYTILLYEYLFLTLGATLPFSAFKVGVFNYLMVAPSQIHPPS